MIIEDIGTLYMKEMIILNIIRVTSTKKKCEKKVDEDIISFNEHVIFNAVTL